MVLFYAILKYTRLGVAMRATRSIKKHRYRNSRWAGLWRHVVYRGSDRGLGGVFVGSSSELGADTTWVSSPQGVSIVIVGGLESPLGAVIAGIGLGVLEVLTSAYVNENLGTFGAIFTQFTMPCHDPGFGGQAIRSVGFKS